MIVTAPVPETAGLISFICGITDRSALEEALARFGQRWVPWGLVSAAALDSPPDAPAEENGPFDTYPEASFDRVMDMNVKGTFLHPGSP